MSKDISYECRLWMSIGMYMTCLWMSIFHRMSMNVYECLWMSYECIWMYMTCHDDMSYTMNVYECLWFIFHECLWNLNVYESTNVLWKFVWMSTTFRTTCLWISYGMSMNISYEFIYECIVSWMAINMSYNVYEFVYMNRLWMSTTFIVIYDIYRMLMACLWIHRHMHVS